MHIVKTNYPIEGYCITRKGGRKENQDTVGYADTPYGFLMVVCDGMGGGPGGQTASKLAVESILEYVKNFESTKADKTDSESVEEIKDVACSEIIRLAIINAEKQIVRFQEENPELQGMGTTVVAVLIAEKSAIVAHVGDSRCYQFRFGSRIFRTEDHSYVANLVRMGQLTEEQARLSSQSNIITKALNGKNTGTPDIKEVPYEKNDRFVLCTDGIWGTMPESELIKKCNSGKNYPMLVSDIALGVDEKCTSDGGGHDNLTLAMIITKKDSILKDTMTRTDRNIRILLTASTAVFAFLAFFFFLTKSCTEKELDQYKSRLENSLEYEKINAVNADSISKLNETIKQLKRDLYGLNQQIESLSSKKNGKNNQEQISKNKNNEGNREEIKREAIKDSILDNLKKIKEGVEKIYDNAYCEKNEITPGIAARDRLVDIFDKKVVNSLPESTESSKIKDSLKKIRDELKKRITVNEAEDGVGQRNAIVKMIDDVIKEIKK